MLPAVAPLGHPEVSELKVPMRPFTNGTLTGENDEVSSVLVCGFFFFSIPNLGSGRSQGGQGLAQGDTAENGSLLHPVLPRDSILSKTP